MKMTLTTKGIIPFGVKCLKCNKTAKAGQWVMYHKAQEMHVVIHRGCGSDLIEEVDYDQLDKSIADTYNSIRESYFNGDVYGKV